MASTGTSEPIELEEDEDDPAGLPAGTIELTGPPPVPAEEDDAREIDPGREEGPSLG